MKVINLYKNLYKLMKLNKPTETSHYRALLRNEFNQNSVSDSKYCTEKDQMVFLGNALHTYIKSTKDTLALYAIYNRGERSVEESANIVGLRLPKQYDHQSGSKPKDK